MSLEEIDKVLSYAEAAMGEELTKKEIEELKNYLLLLLKRRNSLVQKIKDKFSSPALQTLSEENEETPWWNDLYVYYAKGMVITFYSVEKWNEWIQLTELVEGEDYEIIPSGLLIRSDPNSMGIPILDGPESFNIDWNYVEPISLPQQDFHIDTLKCSSDNVFRPAPYVVTNSPDGINPPQAWLDKTSCFRSTWYDGENIDVPTTGLTYYNRYSRPPNMESQPPAIGFKLVDEPTELSLFKNDGTYIISNASITARVQKSWDYKDTFSFGTLNPKPLPLIGQTFHLTLIKILRDVRVRSKEFIMPSDTTFGQSRRKL